MEDTVNLIQSLPDILRQKLIFILIHGLIINPLFQMRWRKYTTEQQEKQPKRRDNILSRRAERSLIGRFAFSVGYAWGSLLRKMFRLPVIFSLFRTIYF